MPLLQMRVLKSLKDARPLFPVNLAHLADKINLILLMQQQASEWGAQACIRRREGGVRNPNVCIPKMAQTKFSFRN